MVRTAIVGFIIESAMSAKTIGQLIFNSRFSKLRGYALGGCTNNYATTEGRMAQRNGRRRTGTPGETRGLPRAEGEGESCTREAREVEGGYEKRWSKSDDYITRVGIHDCMCV